MYFLVIMAIMAPLVATVMSELDRQTTSQIISRTTSLSQARVDGLAWFAMTGYQYVGNNVFVSSTTSTLSWATMKLTANVPDAVKDIAIPASWSIKGNNAQWAVCVGSEDRLTVMALMDRERIAREKGFITGMPNVTFGITGTQGPVGYIGPQTSGVNINVCYA
jgi:hypothetical protein